MSVLQELWSRIGSDSKTQWKLFLEYSKTKSKLDSKAVLSAYSLFMKYNMLQMTYCNTYITNPLYYELPAPNFELFVYVSADPSLKANYSAVDVGQVQIPALKLSSVRTEYSTIYKNQLRSMTSPDYNVNYIDITDSYISKHGRLPAIGDYLHYSLSFFHMLSPLFTNTITGSVIVQDGDN
jgi:hypothetical protein